MGSFYEIERSDSLEKFVYRLQKLFLFFSLVLLNYFYTDTFPIVFFFFFFVAKNGFPDV